MLLHGTAPSELTSSVTGSPPSVKIEVIEPIAGSNERSTNPLIEWDLGPRK